MRTIGIRGMRWAALGACVIGSACTTGASAKDVASLRAEVQKLKEKLKAQDGERPSIEQQKEFLKKREAGLDKKIAGERKEDNVQTEEKRLIQLALDTADKDLKQPANQPGGKIDVFECYESVCKCRTNHLSDKAYQAFARAAFSGVQGTGEEGDRPRIYPGWFSVTEAGAKNGAFSTLFYLGRVQAKKEAPASKPRPK